jgi:two-component system response regulator ResD
MTRQRGERFFMKKMLIVDDDMLLRKLVLTYASVEDFYCQEAENAEQALEQMEAEQFNIVRRQHQ